MNDTKEKSAVGTAIPATEKDIKNLTENIISGNEEKIKCQSFENMTEILHSLAGTLRLTREGRNIESIVPVTVQIKSTEYVKDVARITYKSGRRRDIDIDCDSGIAAVFDVAKCLCY